LNSFTPWLQKESTEPTNALWPSTCASSFSREVVLSTMAEKASAVTMESRHPSLHVPAIRAHVMVHDSPVRPRMNSVSVQSTGVLEGAGVVGT